MRDAVGFVRSDTATNSPDFHLEPQESIVGWYREAGSSMSTTAVFATGALYLPRAELFDRVAWSDIVDFDMPEKRTHRGVRIRTTHGQQVVQITGRSGPANKYEDAFAFVGLLQNLLRFRA